MEFEHNKQLVAAGDVTDGYFFPRFQSVNIWSLRAQSEKFASVYTTDLSLYSAPAGFMHDCWRLG